MVALPPEDVRPNDLPDAELPGARHLVYFCTACHALPSPAMHSATDWPAVVRWMLLRMSLLPAHNVLFERKGGASRLLLNVSVDIGP